MTLPLEQEKPQYYDAKDIIVTFGAVPQEITLLVNTLVVSEKKQLWGIPCQKGKLDGNLFLLLSLALVKLLLVWQVLYSSKSFNLVYPDTEKEVINAFNPTARMLALAQRAIQRYQTQTIIFNENISYQNSVRFGVIASSNLFGVPQTCIDLRRNHFIVDILEME
ncbi:unnamed protein product [Rotaria socialis]|uniref:Uncharacterized protein n=1 Tax=Rotaria socialis TaxID=392032 RepID=A0A818CHH4_9BILA|nr:unnamed protein product [Rotaria socialis]